MHQLFKACSGRCQDRILRACPAENHPDFRECRALQYDKPVDELDRFHRRTGYSFVGRPFREIATDSCPLTDFHASLHIGGAKQAPDNGKAAARQRRKATGLRPREIAGLPKGLVLKGSRTGGDGAGWAIGAERVRSAAASSRHAGLVGHPSFSSLGASLRIPPSGSPCLFYRDARRDVSGCAMRLVGHLTHDEF
jgi:hypothetical protein